MTDAEILAALRNAMFAFASSGAQEYTVAGRTFVRAQVDLIQNLIERYEARVAAASSPSIGGGGVLISSHDGECSRSRYGFEL